MKRRSGRQRPKVATVRRHAQRRARERLGLHWNDADLNRIKNMIQAGQAEFLEKQSHRVSVFRVLHDGVPLVAVYDRNRKTPITVLTVEQWERGKPVLA